MEVILVDGNNININLENSRIKKTAKKTKVNPETGLTAKEELFCMYYVKLLSNGRAAYQAVNPKCKETSAMTKAWELLRKNEVQEYIRILKEQLKKDTKVSLDQLVQAQQDIYNDSVKQVKIYDFKGNDTGQTKMADARAANDALKNMGKWLGYENTTQNVNVNADETVKAYYQDLAAQLKGRQVEGVDSEDEEN